MREQTSNQLTLKISPNDFTVLQTLALAERRRVSDVIRNLLEDVIEGKLELSAPPAKETPKITSVRVSPSMYIKLQALKERTNMSIEKIIHQAAIALEATHP